MPPNFNFHHKIQLSIFIHLSTLARVNPTGCNEYLKRIYSSQYGMNPHLRWASSPGESGAPVLNTRVSSQQTIISIMEALPVEPQSSIYINDLHNQPPHQLHRCRCVCQTVPLPQLDSEEDQKVHILLTLIPTLFLRVDPTEWDFYIIFNLQ